MVKFLFAALLFVFFAAGVNAQSEDCHSKEKAEVTKDNKHCEDHETTSKDTETMSEDTEGSEQPDQVAGALPEVKTVEVKKEVKETGTVEVKKEQKSCCSMEKSKTDNPKK